MNIALISTYELGRQPFGLASPAAWLGSRGHEVTCLDLTRQTLDEATIRDSQLIAIYLPMHTATRLACERIPSVRAQNPQAHLCCYGLYAPLNADYLRSLGVSTILGGEFESGLTQLADRLSGALRDDVKDAPQAEPVISLERLKFLLPDRSGLPALRDYAHVVMPEGGHRVAGYTEASRGCKHRCRHCPIVPVYNGIFRIVDRDVVLADIRQQVAAGAQHISFGDPDFFNGIGHALAIVRALHREFPDLTYDATIKIEHLRQHELHLATLRETNCLLVTTAVESLDDEILRKLDKGHIRSDFLQVVNAFRAIGLTLHPTFVPFTPWTTLEIYRDLLDTLAELDLVDSVAPIQLAIRLLIPAKSRLLELADIARIVEPFDEELLVYPWKHPDPHVDALAQQVESIAANAEKLKWSRAQAFAEIYEAAARASGSSMKSRQSASFAAAPSFARTAVPYLNEPWYC